MTDELAKVVEVRLVSWGDGTKGPWIRIQFDHQDQLEEFRPLKTGSANGQRMAISFALIDDDETTEPMGASASSSEDAVDGDRECAGSGSVNLTAPQHQVSTDSPRPTTEAAPGQASEKTGGFRPVSQTQQAAILCGAADFRAFLSDVYPDSIDLSAKAQKPSELAAKALYAICDVSSRKAFDTDGGARKRWLSLVGEYHTWLSDRACQIDASARLQEAGEG